LKTLFGAGPLESVHANLLHQSGGDVTILARRERYHWLRKGGLVLLNQIAGERESCLINVVRELKPDDHYGLVIGLVRKNKLAPVFKDLVVSPSIETILFIGNSVLGLNEYARYLLGEKLLLAPQAKEGDSRECDPLCRLRGAARTAKARDGRGFNGRISQWTLVIQSLFEAADVSVGLD